MFNSPAYLILLLPLAWMVVVITQWLMGSSFKSRDRAAKDDVVAISQWNAKQQYARQRIEEGKKALAFQDELDQHEQRHEQVYPVRESKSKHLEKEFHIGQEKETTYPERHQPGK